MEVWINDVNTSCLQTHFDLLYFINDHCTFACLNVVVGLNQITNNCAFSVPKVLCDTLVSYVSDKGVIDVQHCAWCSYVVKRQLAMYELAMVGLLIYCIQFVLIETCLVWMELRIWCVRAWQDLWSSCKCNTWTTNWQPVRGSTRSV